MSVLSNDGKLILQVIIFKNDASTFEHNSFCKYMLQSKKKKKKPSLQYIVYETTFKTAEYLHFF